MSLFADRLETFQIFLQEFSLGAVIPLQYELTYVNHIAPNAAWQTVADTGSVFPDYNWRKTDSRFLPAPDAINFRSSFALPDRSGRLHVTLKSGVRKDDREPVLVLELTVRGFPGTPDERAMSSWFETAREWIVRGFADLTEGSVQQRVWGRTT